MVGLLLALVIDAPPECPPVPVGPGEGRVEVVREGAVWVAAVHLGTGTRRITGGDCQTLLDAVAVSLEVLGLRVEKTESDPRVVVPSESAAAPGTRAPSARRPVRAAPTARLRDPPAVAVEAPARAVEAPAVAVEAPARAGEAPARAVEAPNRPAEPAGARAPLAGDETVVVDPVGFSLRLSPVIDLGTTPNLAPGLAISAEVGVAPWSVGLEGHWLATTTAATGGGRVQADALGGTVLGCRAFERFGACGTATVAIQRVGGAGFSVNREAQTPFLSAGLRGRYDLDLGLGAFLEGAVPLSDTRLRVDGEVVWQTAPVTLLIGFGGRLDL